MIFYMCEKNDFINRRNMILEKITNIQKLNDLSKYKLQILNDILGDGHQFTEQQRSQLELAIIHDSEIDILLMLNHTYSHTLMKYIRLCLQANIDIVNIFKRRTFTENDIPTLIYLYKTKTRVT